MHKNSDAFGAPGASEGSNRSTWAVSESGMVTDWKERPHGSLSLEWKSGQRKEVFSPVIWEISGKNLSLFPALVSEAVPASACGISYL